MRTHAVDQAGTTAATGATSGSFGFAPLMERPGDLVGPYKLLSVLGEGGFGIVWLAERREPMVQRVALKIIKPGMDSRQVVARFEQERQALAVMDHPNIAKVFDAGSTATGRPYFVMEHVQGEPITDYCDRHTLTIGQRADLFVSVCKAVQHAHHSGIIHRDLKPSNVLVTIKDERAIPKVIDFGVAKAISQTLTEKTIFTEQGQLIGTPEYMSPEQAEMSALDIDTRTDVYSLGVMLYELLTGLLPFDPKELRSKGYAEIQRIVREVEPARPSTRLSTAGAAELERITRSRQAQAATLRRDLRGSLDWITAKAMSKNRVLRYPSCEALADDLGCYLRGERVSARRPGILRRVDGYLRGREETVEVLLVVILLMLPVLLAGLPAPFGWSVFSTGILLLAAYCLLYPVRLVVRLFILCTAVACPFLTVLFVKEVAIWVATALLYAGLAALGVRTHRIRKRT